MAIPKQCLIASALLLYSFLISAQTTCEYGMSNIFPCKNVTMQSMLTPEELLAEESFGSWLNDVWGWTDSETGKEYALVGMTNGTSFVDISDPIQPRVLGLLPEHHSAESGRSSQPNSTWRDIKVFKDHAFIVSEDLDHGMQIFDLRQLRSVPNTPAVFKETAHYDGISNAHNVVINESKGFAYIVGATRGSFCNFGGLHIVDINDPLNPQYAGCFDEEYTHDAQCLTYNGPDTDYVGREICFNSNAIAITIVDVTDRESPIMISSTTYDNFGYVHQGWLSEDQKYFFSNDEGDEWASNASTKTYIWNVEDLNNPVLIDIFEHESESVDHNLYVKGNFIYQSNYSSGLRILNYQNLAGSGLEEVAYFDTYPLDNRTSFNGSWSNYPFFESGNIIVTDRSNGLFILKPASLLTSIDKKELDYKLNIYPNPTSGLFNLDFSQLPYQHVNLDVHDFSGKRINQQKIDLSSQKEVVFVDKNLKKGIYQIIITNQQDRISKKLIVY